MTGNILTSSLLTALLCVPCQGFVTGQDVSQPQAAPTPSPTPGPSNAGVKNETATNPAANSQGENNDLDRIPMGTQDPKGSNAKAPAANAANQKVYLENAFLLSGEHGLIVPLPLEPSQTSWQERLFLDVRKEWKVKRNLNFTLSNRLTFRAENDISFPTHENVINEFREGFLSWEPVERAYVDIGRINLRSGAALGFNPTDFFKTRAVVEPLTSDPSVLREDRLGTLMLEGQYIGQGRAFTIALAPDLVRPSTIHTNTTLPSFNPSIDRTNDHFRLLIKTSFSTGHDFSPELLFYHEGNQIKFGINLTRSLGRRIIVYGEWAGGQRTGIVDEALRYGRETGTVPANAVSAIPVDSTVRFENDLSLGGSCTNSKKITFNLEYHLHQAGFSGKDWNSWFAAGRGQTSSSPIARGLWYIREYALDQQEPLARHSTFLRMDWVDAFIPKLEITGFINTDIYDGSSLIQASADYYVSKAWTIGGQVNGNPGSRNSDFGSLPQSVGVLLKVARYF
jgi:hypothetical protein